MSRVRLRAFKHFQSSVADIAGVRAFRALSLCLIAALGFSACDSQTTNRSAPVSQSNGNMMNSNMSGNMSNISEGTEADARSSERYAQTDENPFLEVGRAPLSTFSIDVDTASYTNARRFLNENRLPPADAVRIEEFINYFSYDYPQPVGDVPFSVTTEVAECPWSRRHRLALIGLQGRQIQSENLPPANLVFLIDVSGSMQDADKLPLLKRSLEVLVGQLTARDRISIVVYAGSSGLVLPSTTGDRRTEITAAINALQAGGSTNGGEGIRLAYRVAQDNFIRGGTNRVILATDGDFNVGVTSQNDLVELIEEKRQTGVFLSVLGFGTGNLNDATMEQLADRGNGNYSYIDSFEEGRRVLGREIGGTLTTIAKDVRLQVEFNPRHIASYRLIGYENRLMRDRDFDDDTRDAGEIGANHSVTAIYEIVPVGEESGASNNPPLRYQQPAPGTPPAQATSGELMTVQLRYKEPTATESRLLSIGVPDVRRRFEDASENFRFASSVASFGMLLRNSRHKGDATYNGVLERARAARGADLQGYRAEFITLVETARRLAAER